MLYKHVRQHAGNWRTWGIYAVFANGRSQYIELAAVQLLRRKINICQMGVFLLVILPIHRSSIQVWSTNNSVTTSPTELAMPEIPKAKKTTAFAWLATRYSDHRTRRHTLNWDCRRCCGLLWWVSFSWRVYAISSHNDLKTHKFPRSKFVLFRVRGKFYTFIN